MLRLKQSLLIGKGRHRNCYVHPGKPDNCVKVVVFGDDKETLRERAFYRLLERRKTPMTMISGYFGEVDTDLGQGTVFELIRDFDGGVSKTLEHYLAFPGNTGVRLDSLLVAIESLRKYMLREKILTMTLKAKNLVYKRTGPWSGRLVIVDSLGNSEFFPISSRIGFLADMKIRRRWRRFGESLRSNLKLEEGRAWRRRKRDGSRPLTWSGDDATIGPCPESAL